MQSLLSFVGEPYSATCLEPLGERINSSNVPVDFKSADPATNRAIVDDARQLSIEMQQTAQPAEPSAVAADEMEAAFQRLCLRGRVVEQALTSQIARQEEHHTGTIARQERHYKNRLYKQARDLEQLTAMLDAVVTIAERLRCSRFWRFANRAATIEAKLFSTKEDVPDRRLRKIIRNYSRWRASHPDVANVDKPIHYAESPASADDSNIRLEHSSLGTAKVSKKT
jgi:hypothetical protein